MTDRDLQNAPIRWKIQGAGFVMQGGFVVLVDQDPDPFPCTVYNGPEDGRDAHEDACRETGPPSGGWRATRWKRPGRPWRSPAFGEPPTT